jgi:HD superfamily phosphodiesterase
MNASDSITQAEKKYINLLESFFIQKWGSTNLKSHDLSHHRRVWSFARELLTYTHNNDPVFIDKLLIACYLHDTGMATDSSEKHGRYSMLLCREFLLKEGIDPEDYSDLLYAVANHDNKEYTEAGPESPLLMHLSAADDLDAFGYTGIYRYLEIYLIRGISPDEIVTRVLKNSEARFTSLERNFKAFPELIEKHKNRFQILQDYFKNLDSEITEYH